MRIGARHPWLGAAGFHLALPLLEGVYRRRHVHRAGSDFARARIAHLKDKIERGEAVTLAGVSAAGTHNSGVALIEVTRAGPRPILNNEEERFSGVKHTNAYPQQSIEAMRAYLAGQGRGPDGIDAWFSSWDYAALAATLIRTFLEEAPASLRMLTRREGTPLFNSRDLDRGYRAARHIGHQLGFDAPVDLIGTPHHENHAWFSFAVSPFAREKGPVMVAVLDGLGDMGAISLYVVENGRMKLLYANNSVFDSLGIFYAVISSTQGGWTWLSSEGRYMGATAYGDNDRRTNPYYKALKEIFCLRPDGQIFINRDLANWPRDILRQPYTAALKKILGEPIAQEDMWNPDAVLRIEDITHSENTQSRLDKAAATQMVFEDALMHVIDHFIRATASEQAGADRRHRPQRARQYARCSSISTPAITGARSTATRACICGCRRCRTTPASRSGRPIWAPIWRAMGSGQPWSTLFIAACRRRRTLSAPRLRRAPMSNGSSWRRPTAIRRARATPISWPL